MGPYPCPPILCSLTLFIGQDTVDAVMGLNRVIRHLETQVLNRLVLLVDRGESWLSASYNPAACPTHHFTHYRPLLSLHFMANVDDPSLRLSSRKLPETIMLDPMLYPYTPIVPGPMLFCQSYASSTAVWF